MVRLSIATAAVAYGLGITSASKSSGGGGDSPVMRGNIARFHPNAHIELDIENSDYIVEFSFKHDETLPIPPNIAADCGKLAPEDGFPYAAPRENYFKLPKSIRQATGFDHISLDWNPCGHPAFEYFGTPHYDLHVYRHSIEDRAERTCDVVPGTPACTISEQQPNAAGRKFFNVARDLLRESPADMPDNFTCGADSGVLFTGIHCYDSAQAVPVADWKEPILVMGNYDAEIAFWEPMFPKEFVMGDTNNHYEEDVEYVSQTLESLPYHYSMSYSKDTGFTTLIMTGTALAAEGAGKSKGGKKDTRNKKERKRLGGMRQL